MNLRQKQKHLKIENEILKKRLSAIRPNPSIISTERINIEKFRMVREIQSREFPYVEEIKRSMVYEISKGIKDCVEWKQIDHQVSNSIELIGTLHLAIKERSFNHET